MATPRPDVYVGPAVYAGIAAPTGELPGEPIAPSAAYRNAQPYLFSSISTPVIPDRLGGPPGWDLNISQSFGTMRTFVDWRTGWRWDNDGGDWIDASGTRMGGTPWASVATPAAGAAATYAVTVTTALQRVQTTGRWNAWIVRAAPGSTAPRTWAGRFNATATYRPRIEVTYTDASTATLACRVSAFLGVGTSQPSQGEQTFSLNAAAGTGAAALEFDLPTKPVSSATLHFTVVNHWSGAATLEFNLADPPLNTSPVTTGVADAYPLDEGLSAEPSIMGVHRYVDAADILDFWQSTTVTTNPDNDWNFSADVGGTGPNDATMLPRKGAGKFVPANLYGGGLVSLVGSSYSAESFTPLAPGMGAMRLTMPKPAGITDGFVGGDSGTASVNAYIHLPVDKIDTLSHIFVRYYQLIGTTADTGNPYRVDVSKKYEVEGSGPSVIKWTDMGGKFSISPCGKTVNGGNSMTSGGGGGWVLRPHWADYWADSVSPGVGGWEMEFEWDDFKFNPAGYNYYSDVPAGFASNKDFNGWGQKGGLAGVMYAGRWYCIEEELKLNSVATANAQDGRYWQPDGEVRVWVDGRLVYEVTGVVMRSLPAESTAPGYIQIKPGGIGATQLGIKHLWFNWFHGGTTQNSIDRVAFVTGLAWGTSRIGPMKIPSALPAWRVGQAALTWSQFGNAASTVDPAADPAVNPNYPGRPPWQLTSSGVTNGELDAVWDAWCGGAYDETIGRLWVHGGGHADYAGNEVYALDVLADSPQWARLIDPTGAIGNTGTLDDLNEAANEYFDGRPRSIHSYDSLVALAGDLWVMGQPAPFRTASTTTASAFRFNGAANDWTKLLQGGTPFLGTGAACHDTLRNRIYAWKNNAAAPSYWDVASGTAGTDTSFWPNISATEVTLLYLPEYDVQVCLSRQYAGGFGVADYGRTGGGFVNEPGASGSPPTYANTTGYNARIYHNGVWVPGFGGGVGAILCWHGGTGFWVLTPPASGNVATEPWAWTMLSAGGGNAVDPGGVNPNGTFGRLFYSAALRGIGLSLHHDQPTYFFALES